MVETTQTPHFFSKKIAWFFPALILLFIAPFSTWLDLTIAKVFYSPETQTFPSNPYYDFFFDYGFYPANLLAGGSILIFIFSFFFQKWKKWRAPTLLLWLTLAVGAGLIVHFAFKDHWGRPRPRQVIEFGGTQPFRPFYEPHFDHDGSYKSFPCGHCSTGFYFLALVVLAERYRNRTLFYWGIAFTAFLGISLSIGRMGQGGHFFSDILVSAFVMWWTALFFDWLIYDKFLKLPQSTQRAQRK